jgi:WD repeat and SOCS box-containing protein 1
MHVNGMNMIFSPSVQSLCYCRRFQVHLWNMKTREQTHRLVGHRNNVTKCAFSPDGILLATASYDSRVIIWNVQLGVAIRYFE